MSDVEQAIRDDIVSGKLAFGTRLRIDELASRYGVGHMPVRGALRVLHGEGLVVIEPNRGARVLSVRPGFIEDLFDMRAALETMLARRAAERRTNDHLQRLRRAEEELEARVEERDFASVAEANRRFHTVINDAAGNPGALVVVDRHWLLLSALLRRYGHGDERFQRVIDDHHHIIHSIERRDTAAAAALMGAHIEKAKNNLLRRASEHSLMSDGDEAGADAEEGWAKWQTAL